MIKNGRQYALTKAQAARFEQALAELAGKPESERPRHPLLRKAEEDALRSQLDDLRREMAEYEALRSGQPSVIHIRSLGELADGLIRARIASHISHKDLARRLGLKEQQVQRYEATDYASASLKRITQIAQALHLEVEADVTVATNQEDAPPTARRPAKRRR